MYFSTNAQEICSVQTKQSIVEDCELAFYSQALEGIESAANQKQQTNMQVHTVNLLAAKKDHGMKGISMVSLYSSEIAQEPLDSGVP